MITKKPRTDLSPGSITKLRNHFSRTSPRNLAIFELSLGSGLRRREVLSLTWEDINWVERTLQVIGKGQKLRVVHFTELAFLALNALPRSNGPIFDLQPNSWFVLLRNAARRCKLPERVHPHSLRHAYAMHYARSGINIGHLQRALGHAHLNTTAVYLHYNDTEAAKAMALVAPL